jgi:hypothetical protein
MRQIKSAKIETDLVDTSQREVWITPKQVLFCNYYIKNDELRWNWTLAYNEAFDIWLDEKSRVRKKDEKWKEIFWTSEYDKAYNLCSVNACKLLKQTKIQEKNVELLNDKKIDSRLAQIIYNWKDTDSLNAIKIYNDLRSRIKNKLELSWTINTEDASAKEWLKEIQQLKSKQKAKLEEMKQTKWKSKTKLKQNKK